MGNSKLKTVLGKDEPLSHKKIKRVNFLREELSFRKYVNLSGRSSPLNGS
jgi:hypothetical protein